MEQHVYQRIERKGTAFSVENLKCESCLESCKSDECRVATQSVSAFYHLSSYKMDIPNHNSKNGMFLTTNCMRSMLAIKSFDENS